jgi:S-DNA-T family DNA segregation ATPase FtsK/SpoIIIE
LSEEAAAIAETKNKSTVSQDESVMPTSEKEERITQTTSQPVNNVSSTDTATLELIQQLDAACRLRRFKIEKIDSNLVVLGPTLTNIPVVLEPGESIKPIETALPDLARELGVRTIAVENDPRPYHIRFLIPRPQRIFPPLPVDSTQTLDANRQQYFGILLGQTIEGLDYRSWVSEWPHLLVAGTTGSGKTTLLKSIVTQLGRLPTNLLRVIIIDGKGEFDYVGLLSKEYYAENFPDVLLGHEHVPEVLRWLVTEDIPRRRETLRAYLTKNPQISRQPREAFVRAVSEKDQFPIVPLVIFIDEFAELMLAAGSGAREFEDLIQRAVQTGRSCLVHLLLATQRPDANVIKGAIKANLPSRIALALPSHHDSMTILNAPGAEDLLGSGDMYFYSSTGTRIRLQGYRI